MDSERMSDAAESTTEHAAPGNGAAGGAASENGAITLDLTIERDTSTPLYLQLAGGIEDAIRSGVLPPGSRLENELALSKRLKLSRPTLYARLDTLSRLLGADLNNAESRTSLHAALMIIDPS